MAASTTLVYAVPIASRTTPTAGLMLLQSLSGLNARSTVPYIAMLRTLSTVSTLKKIPARAATIRRGQGGSTSATATAIIPALRLGTPDATTVSTMPWTAATTLPQYRGGNGAASHGISQPASSSA